MAEISVYKDLLKQVSCDAIPSEGFSPEDLDKVKACAKKVTPTETSDFDPDPTGDNPPVDKDMVEQTECIADAADKARKIIMAEQRKMPNAIKYAALRGKVQELRDNTIAAKTYFTERYNWFTNVLSGTDPFTSQYLYWDDEYSRLTNLVITANTAAENAHSSNSVLKRFIKLLFDNSTDTKLGSPTIRTAFTSLTQNYSNVSTVATALGADSSDSSLYQASATSLTNSTKINELVTAIKNKIAARQSRELARDNAISAQSQLIQSTPSLEFIGEESKNDIQNVLEKISHQISVKLSPFSTTESPISPAGIASFKFYLIDKSATVVRVTQYDSSDEPLIGPDGTTVQADETFIIYNSPALSKNVFANRTGFGIEGVSLWQNGQDESTRHRRDYSILSGLLYNGYPSLSYPGLYKKMSKPIQYLFTLAERGLTLNADLVDPVLKSVKDAPISIKEDEITLFIRNQSTYENFYQDLPTLYPRRIDNERNQVFPNQIEPYLNQLRQFARREAATIFRRDPESALKLARPVSYTSSPGSSVFSQGTFEYSSLDQTLSAVLLYYKQSLDKINELIDECDIELDRLQQKIKENSMDEQTLKDKLLAIPCFAKAGEATQAANNVQGSPSDDDEPEVPGANTGTGQEDCAKKTAGKKGTDPLYLRTLAGTDTSLPDLTSQCYWKEFAKALNKVCLLPFPDLSGFGSSNIVFRYWPINCILPIPFGLTLLPIPPVWRSLFVLPTPLGTLVCFLTMPIAPIGIPLPSIYLFFFAIDGNKYLALATNVPILYAPPTNLKFGFVQDNSAKSANPLGLVPTNPYKGQPIKGALTAPIAVNALTAKAQRLTALAAMVASGQPYITNANGTKLPVNIKFKDLFKNMPSEAEAMLSIANASPFNDFSRQMEQFKITINRQLDKLGNMPIPQIQSLKQQLAKKREIEEQKAFSEIDPTTRRLNRQKARNIKLTNVKDKIRATTQAMTTHIDNIKLGTIKYPKDPTKFNPELPSAFTALLDIVELAVTGDLKVESSAIDLGKQLTRVISKIRPADLSTKKKFNLKDPAEFEQFKGALKKLTKSTVDYLKGKEFTPNTAGAKTQQQAQEIAEAEKAQQQKLAKAISLTALALASPVSLNIFDFGKKCCEVQAKDVLSTIPIPVQVAFNVITSLLESLIDALNPNVVIKTLGVKKGIVDVSQVGQMLESMIKKIPTVKLPDPASLQVLVLALIVPILSIISLPKAPAPLHLPTIPLVIPLDPLLKPLIKKALGAVVEGSFNLMDQAANAVLAAEIDAKAEAEAKAAAAGLQGSGAGSNGSPGSEAGAGSGGTGSQTGSGAGSGSGGTGSQSGSQSTGGTGTVNPQLSNNSEAGTKILKKAFKTACGDTGITATLTLESRIELNEIIRTLSDTDKLAAAQFEKSDNFERSAKVKASDSNYEGYQETLRAAQTSFDQSFEATSTSKAILSIELPDGDKFDLPEMPFVALDIGGSFDLLTGADIVEMIRSIINSIFNKIIKPIELCVKVLSIISMSLNTFSYTTIEAGIPYVNIIKLILMAIDAVIPPGIKLKAANLQAMEIVKNIAITALSAVEPVVKEVLWIASLAACALGVPPSFSSVSLARLAHPIMNQDDLPPWERLTHKNPLFAIFLDEIAWRGSIYSTGSLIFQTKTPAVLPYTPILPIVHVPIHTLQPD